MKDKILTLIIGILIGAIVTAGIFLIINKINENNMPKRPDMSNFGGMQEGNPAKTKKENSNDQNTFDTENFDQNLNGEMPPDKPDENMNNGNNGGNGKTKQKQNSNSNTQTNSNVI